MKVEGNSIVKACRKKRGQPQDMLLTLDFMDNSNGLCLTHLCACACSLQIFISNHCSCLRVAQCMCKSLNPCVIMAVGILYIPQIMCTDAFSFHPAAGVFPGLMQLGGGHSPSSAYVYEAHTGSPLID